MPYYLEKGPVLTLIEKYINRSVPGKRAVLEKLRAAERAAAGPGVDWVKDALPDLWADPAFDAVPKTFPHVLEHWLGFQQNPVTEVWSPAGHATTGYWKDYEGNVNAILLAAFRWALEMALGLMPSETGPGLNPPARIELFWICSAAWFETWVVQRPTPSGQRLVSVIFVTPTHTNAQVSTTPVATSPTTRAGLGHPVPSTERDYELVSAPPAPPRGVPAAVGRDYATWVVTHRRHNLMTTPGNKVKITNTGSETLGVIPAAGGAIWQGSGGPVIVSPSVPAGGAPHTGVI
jgi:hypothetical protein